MTDREKKKGGVREWQQDKFLLYITRLRVMGQGQESTEHEKSIPLFS